MADNEPAILRKHAEQCRKLAKSVNDQRSIDALYRTAREYDEEAERVESLAPAD
jgi:hypothetical protein